MGNDDIALAVDSPMPCSTYWIAAIPLALLKVTCQDGQSALRWLCAVCNEWHDNCKKDEENDPDVSDPKTTGSSVAGDLSLPDDGENGFTQADRA